MSRWVYLGCLSIGVVGVMVLLEVVLHLHQSRTRDAVSFIPSSTERGETASEYRVLLSKETLKREARIEVTGEEDWMTDFQESMIVLHSPPLVHCSIPRIGCSRWKRLLRKMEGYRDYLSLPPHTRYRNGLKHSVDLLPSTMEKVLNSPDYFRFVLVRDPFSRLLSAWLAKRNRTFAVPIPNRFSKFVQNVTHTLLSYNTHTITTITTNHNINNKPRLNQHFKPVSHFCGLASIPFDFVGRLETLDEWGPLLIRRIGAERDATSGWGPNGTFLASSMLLGSLAMNASSPALLRQYYTPDLVDLVAAAYAEDITLFNYTQFRDQLRRDTAQHHQLHSTHQQQQQHPGGET